MTASRRPIGQLPSARAKNEQIIGALANRRLAVFLDYDGTLTPIVDRPEDAHLPRATRAALERLRTRCPIAVVSGRDLADVRRMVGVDGIWYAGSHGFDILGPEGERRQRGAAHVPALDRAEAALRKRLETVDGVRVERKTFAIAVHWRGVAPERVADVETPVDAVAREERDLRKTGGKKIFELRPALDWDKGKALLWLLQLLELDGPDVLPMYVGDDVTDEDAFRAIAGRGVGIVVRGEDDDRQTAASYALDHPAETRWLLEALAEALPEL